MPIKIDMPNKNSWLADSGYTREEEGVIYDKTLQDVLDNTRWYLDNLNYIREYRVSWNCYIKYPNKPILPLKFVNSPKDL